MRFSPLLRPVHPFLAVYQEYPGGHDEAEIRERVLGGPDLEGLPAMHVHLSFRAVVLRAGRFGQYRHGGNGKGLAGENVVGRVWIGGHRDIRIGGAGGGKAPVANLVAGNLFAASWQLWNR